MVTVVTRTNRTRRLIAGAFVAAAVAVPLYAAMTTAEAGPQVNAGPECLAWFGNKEDGKCLSYSNGPIVNGGVPQIAYGTPGSGSPGFSSGPLLPGNTWNTPLG